MKSVTIVPIYESHRMMKINQRFGKRCSCHLQGNGLASHQNQPNKKLTQGGDLHTWKTLELCCLFFFNLTPIIQLASYGLLYKRLSYEYGKVLCRDTYSHKCKYNSPKN